MLLFSRVTYLTSSRQVDAGQLLSLRRELVPMGLCVGSASSTKAGSW